MRLTWSVVCVDLGAGGVESWNSALEAEGAWLRTGGDSSDVEHPRGIRGVRQVLCRPDARPAPRESVKTQRGHWKRAWLRPRPPRPEVDEGSRHQLQTPDSRPKAQRGAHVGGWALGVETEGLGRIAEAPQERAQLPQLPLRGPGGV